jgi:hypothetical protein
MKETSKFSATISSVTSMLVSKTFCAGACVGAGCCWESVVGVEGSILIYLVGFIFLSLFLITYL